MTQPGSPWLLLLHHIPPSPPYLRAKVMRRLNALGALPLKKSAYLLPDSDAALEDFQWLRRHIVEEGGAAWVLRGAFVAGASDDQVREAFRSARAADYEALGRDARALLERARGGAADDSGLAQEWRRIARRAHGLKEADFFGAPGRSELEALMDTIDRLLHPAVDGPAPARDALKGRTWMTRPGVKVDRIASAWLIRRFIDPAATFTFADDAASTGNVLRFDMFEGDFTHDGDRCTFEVLLDAAGLDDTALGAIGHIVHDIDLKDDRYQRAETAGVAAMVAGLVARHADDRQRLAEGAVLFDALYESLAKGGSR